MRQTRLIFALPLSVALCGACITPESTGQHSNDSAKERSRASDGKDRALLIGVGDHAHDPFDLPGIAYDIEMMRDVVRAVGFSDDQVRVLLDRDVTVNAVRKQFEEFLAEAGPNDRVLVYFSGHGTSLPDTSGDEADGRDEALVMSDASSMRKGTDGLLLDDDIEALFRSLKAGEQTFLVDSCHSGTVHRSFLPMENFGPLAKDARAKFISWAEQSEEKALEAPTTAAASDLGFVEAKTTKARPANPRRKFRAMTAAADDEQSLATHSGSVFTMGLSQIVHDATTKSRALSMQQLFDGVTGFVNAKLSSKKFHPQLFGDALREPLWSEKVYAKAAGPGSYWRRVAGLIEGGTPLRIESNQSSYRLGDELRLTIEAPVDGYLNILTVGPDDKPVVLFPNAFDGQNRVTKGRFTWPTSTMNFAIQAQPPIGEALIVAVLTTTPRNFMDESLAPRKGADGNYQTKDPFPTASYRSFGIVKREQNSERYAAKLVLSVTQ